MPSGATAWTLMTGGLPPELTVDAGPALRCITALNTGMVLAIPACAMAVAAEAWQ